MQRLRDHRLGNSPKNVFSSFKRSLSNSCCCCLVSKSYPTLCNPKHCRLLCPWDFPGKDTGGVAISFSRGIFPTQGSNPHQQHWQMDSLPLSHLESSLKCFLNAKHRNSKSLIQAITRFPRYFQYFVLPKCQETCDTVF